MEAQRGQQKSVIDIGTRHVRHHGYDYVELRIEDQGPGIDAEVLEHLYEPYVSTKPKGGGLGLAIVKKIIEEHGGMVRVSNKADGGARVVIQFPLPEGVVRGTTTGEFDAVSKVV
jgi:signal transduction histidine kinase